MRISKDHKIWLAANNEKDESRPALNHVLIERTDEEWETPDGKGPKGLAIAANGFVLAVVPVELEETDVPGMVRADVLREAVKQFPSRHVTAEIQLLETEVRFLGRMGLVTVPRLTDAAMKQKEYCKYPDWRNIVPKKPEPSEGPTGTFAIEPSQLKDMADILGVHAPRITRTGSQNDAQRRDAAEGPMIMQVPGSNGELIPPFGIMMPYRFNR